MERGKCVLINNDNEKYLIKDNKSWIIQLPIQKKSYLSVNKILMVITTSFLVLILFFICLCIFNCKKCRF